MKEQVLAKRYAEAYFSRVKDSGLNIEEAAEELSGLKILLYQNPDFYAFLKNVDFLYLEKCEAIDNALKHLSPGLREFLKLLIRKERIASLVDICDYARLNYTHPGRTDALLKTTYPLDLELVNRIKDALEKKLNKRLQLHIELDAELLGGVRVSVGNTVFDGSVKKKLSDLREMLQAIKVG